MRTKQFATIETAKMAFNTEKYVEKFITSSLELCMKSNIADLMSISVKVSKDKKRVTYLKPHLPAIAARISDLSLWKFRDASAVVFGLQYMDLNDPGVVDIVKSMTSAISQIVTSGDRNVTPIDISKLFLGLQRFNSEGKEIIDLLRVMALVIKNCREQFTALAISESMYGMLHMTSDKAEVREVISALGRAFSKCTGDLTDQDFVNISFGLRGMNSEYAEVREALSVYARKLKESTIQIKALTLCKMLAGLDGKSSDYSEVRDVLSAITTRIESSKEILKAKALGNALGGLSGLNNDRREVRTLLSVLALKVKKSEDEWNGISLSSSFLGMSRLSDQGSVLELLDAIAFKFRFLKEELSSQHLADCVHGLQNMGSDSISVRNVLFALDVELKKSTSVFCEKTISESFYGLQNMKTDSAEVFTIFKTLSMKIQSVPLTAVLSAKQLSDALYGIQGLRKIEDNTIFNNVLDALYVRTGKLNVLPNDENVLPNVPEVSDRNVLENALLSAECTADLVALRQSLFFYLQEMEASNDENRISQWQNIANNIMTEIQKRRINMDSHFVRDEKYSDSQIAVFDAIVDIFADNENVRIERDEILLDAFQTNVSIKFINPLDTELIDQTIIIDVDSVSDKKDKKKLFRSRREKYLKASGIKLIKIHDATIDDMSKEDLTGWLRDKIKTIV